MVSMKDVSRHAGVSVATVSNVITGKRVVSEKVRRKVEQSIKDLNYQVNYVARGLKTQRTNTIGIILPDITKLFFQKVIIGILDMASATGYRINILSSGYDFETERMLINTLISSCVDGIILDSCVRVEDGGAWAEELASAGGRRPPIVLLESTLNTKKLSSITIDNRLYSSMIAQHLIDIGRRRILYVAGPMQIEHEYARFQGYVDCLRKNGVDTRELLLKPGSYLSESGYTAVREAFEAGVPFDAVQASNDQAAIGALKFLREKGLRVPEDVAITGFDNLFPSSLVTPAITTVSVPNYEMGEASMVELSRLIADGDAAPAQRILSASIEVRASTCAEVASEWDLTNW